MTPPDSADTLRRAAAHVLVESVHAPVLDDEAQHHVFKVLRVRDGEVVTVTDGVGAWRRCRAVGRAIIADGDVHHVGEPESPTTVGFVIPKQDRPEWIVQKLTELGVDNIVLLESERSVVRLDHTRAEKRLVKLKRVAAEAVQQCRRVRIPSVTGPVPATTLLPTSVAAEPGGRSLADHDRSIVVGPEGGWTDAELEVAADRVSLGATVLRVETAALVAGTLITRG